MAVTLERDSGDLLSNFVRKPFSCGKERAQLEAAVAKTFQALLAAELTKCYHALRETGSRALPPEDEEGFKISS